jgi:hypothetical protein
MPYKKWDPFTELWLCDPALGLADPERVPEEPEGSPEPPLEGPITGPCSPSFGPCSALLALGYCCQESRRIIGQDLTLPDVIICISSHIGRPRMDAKGDEVKFPWLAVSKEPTPAKAIIRRVTLKSFVLRRQPLGPRDLTLVLAVHSSSRRAYTLNHIHTHTSSPF